MGEPKVEGAGVLQQRSSPRTFTSPPWAFLGQTRTATTCRPGARTTHIGVGDGPVRHGSFAKLSSMATHQLSLACWGLMQGQARRCHGTLVQRTDDAVDCCRPLEADITEKIRCRIITSTILLQDLQLSLLEHLLPICA